MTKQRLFFLDFETFWSADYTLSKMTPPEYILDERFDAQYLAVIEATPENGIDGGYGVDGPDIAAWVRDIDPSSAITVTHNAMFDSAILAWRYGWVPSTIVCTKLLTQATIGAYLPDNRLKTIAKTLGLGVKDEQALLLTKGQSRQEIVANGHWDRFTQYCLSDARQCAGIFFKLAPLLPARERRIMDMVLRCTIEPQLVLDVALLDAHINHPVTGIRAKKAQLIESAGVTVEEVMSAPKFRRALENIGIEVELKTSPTGRQIPAFARTDDFMARLAEHDDPRVQALAAARLGHKSTIEETRCQRLLSIGRLPISAIGNRPGLLPVPLVYSGTHTHRLSGTWKLNLQNLPKGTDLRNALCAPPGWKLLVADLSQIEARIVACMAGQTDLVDAFARGKDVYAIFASSVFGYDIDKKQHPNERFIGKTAVLGLGYGCGAKKFYNMVVRSARQFGIDLRGEFNEDLAEKTKSIYRGQYAGIPELWYKLDTIIRDVLSQHPSKDVEQWIGEVKFMPGKIRLPGGLFLQYPKLKNTDGQWSYTWSRKTSNIWGGALLENIVQALARNVAMDAAYRLARLGLKFVMQVHDELVFVVPEDTCRSGVTDVIEEEMTRRPAWMPELPLAVEISKPVDRYGEAK